MGGGGGVEWRIKFDREKERRLHEGNESGCK